MALETNGLLCNILNCFNESDLAEIIITNDLGKEFSSVLHSCKEYPKATEFALRSIEIVF